MRGADRGHPAANWTFPLVYALEVAERRLRGGDAPGALAALWLGLRGVHRVTPPMRRLLARCVRAQPSLAPLALRVAISAGTPLDRVRSVVAVAAARLSGQTTATGAADRPGGNADSASSIRETNWLFDR